MKERFSAPVQIGLGAYPYSFKMGIGSLPGVKRPGLGVDHTTHLERKAKVELYLCYPSGPSWPFLGELYLYLYLLIADPCSHPKCSILAKIVTLSSEGYFFRRFGYFLLIVSLPMFTG